MVLGKIKIKEFLNKTNGLVIGQVITDGKIRIYKKEYKFEELENDMILIQPKDGTGNKVTLKNEIDLDESTIAFFGYKYVYSH